MESTFMSFLLLLLASDLLVKLRKIKATWFPDV